MEGCSLFSSLDQFHAPFPSQSLLRCQSNVTECQDNTVKRTYLVYPMTRQEMKKLLDELDNKHAETYVEELKKGP